MAPSNKLTKKEISLSDLTQYRDLEDRRVIDKVVLKVKSNLVRSEQVSCEDILYNCSLSVL